jgi:hypothetical protein
VAGPSLLEQPAELIARARPVLQQRPPGVEQRRQVDAGQIAGKDR